METRDILDELNFETTSVLSTSYGTLETPFDISPQNFIKYAEIDLTSDYEHNIINALSNSKRALDCQLDTLLFAFGYYRVSQKEFWSFPKKIELISELGIIAPRVLHKVNRQRNLLEHQFIKPNKETVEDFLDIAMLFIASTDRYSLKFITTINFSNTALKKSILLTNKYSEELFEIKIREKNASGEFKADPLIHLVHYKDPDYKLLLKEYLNHY